MQFFSLHWHGGMDSAQSDAVVGVAVDSGNAEDVSAIAHSKKASIPRLAGFDDSSDGYFDGSVAVRSPSKATQPHPRLYGFDDLSDEYFICVDAKRNACTRHSERNVLHPFASRRTRHSKRNVLLEQQIEESLLFQPADVDPCRCQALNFVRVQCQLSLLIVASCIWPVNSGKQISIGCQSFHEP